MTDLYPYQREGVAFLLDRSRAYLADEMGLGKSVQALVAAQRSEIESVLVIAPASTLPNWRAEAEHWGDPAWRFRAISYADKRLRDGSIDGADWDVVIVDEAHYIKSRKAKRTKNVLRVCNGASRAWLLSGTPMPNHAGELWTIFDGLWPEKLEPHRRSFMKWLQHFCRYTHTRYGPRVYGHQNASELRLMLSDIMLRRKLEDVGLDLPPLRVDIHRLPKPDNWDLGTDDMDVLTSIQDEQARDEPSLSRVRRLLGTLKAPHVAHQLSHELDDGAYGKIVVLYHHRDVGDVLEEALRVFGTVRLDGSSTPRQRQSYVDAFNADDTTRVFLGQQTSAGTGLNLQVAHEVVLVEPSWVPDENRQAIKRIHRIGQDAPCRARIFTISGTLDEGVMKTIALKTTLQQMVGLH